MPWKADRRRHRPLRDVRRVDADHSLTELVLHIDREAIHHGAEIACLRDFYLYRHTVNQED
jgi:hypothetical protein